MNVSRVVRTACVAVVAVSGLVFAAGPVSGSVGAAKPASGNGPVKKVDNYCQGNGGYFTACVYFDSQYKPVTPGGPDTSLQPFVSLGSSSVVKTLLYVGYQVHEYVGEKPTQTEHTNWATSPVSKGTIVRGIGYTFNCNDYGYRPIAKYKYLDTTPKNHYVTQIIYGNWDDQIKPCTGDNP